MQRWLLRRALPLALAAVSSWACKGDADFSGAMPTPVTLNADLYRSDIVAIDRLVFEDQPFDDARRQSLAGKLDELSRRVKSSSDSKFIALEALELKGLAAAARRFSNRSRPDALQNNWIRVRANLFDDRSWFARSAADVEPASARVASVDVPQRIVSRDAALPVMHGIDGRWRVTSLSANGRAIADSDLSGSVWTLAGEDLSIRNSSGKVNRYTAMRISDAGGTGLFIESLPGNERPERGWMIYDVSQGKLTVAFYDGLADRPRGFTPSSGGHTPPLMVAILTRER